MGLLDTLKRWTGSDSTPKVDPRKTAINDLVDGWVITNGDFTDEDHEDENTWRRSYEKLLYEGGHPGIRLKAPRNGKSLYGLDQLWLRLTRVSDGSIIDDIKMETIGGHCLAKRLPDGISPYEESDDSIPVEQRTKTRVRVQPLWTR